MCVLIMSSPLDGFVFHLLLTFFTCKCASKSIYFCVFVEDLDGFWHVNGKNNKLSFTV